MVSMAQPPSATRARGAEYTDVTGDVTATEQDDDRKLGHFHQLANRR